MILTADKDFGTLVYDADGKEIEWLKECDTETGRCIVLKTVEKDGKVRPYQDEAGFVRHEVIYAKLPLRIERPPE